MPLLGLAAAFVVGLTLMIAPMPAAHATPAVTTWTVTDSGDGAATPGNCPGTGCRLRDALAASALGDTIVFSLTYPATITRLLPGSFSITHSVTISGPGASNLAVSGNNTGRVFLIGSSGLTVTLSGLTIKDGSVPGSTGGGISNAGILTLTDSVVLSNTASQGGGIFNSGSMSVTSTPVMSNTAGTSGAGIHNAGTMTVTNTMVISNTTTGASGIGGGIYNTGTFTLTGVTVRGNTANDGGGLYPAVGSMMLDSSSVISNTAESNGGGIRNSVALTITNSAILSNTAQTLAGGGIYNTGASVFITNTTLSGNSAPLAAGGGIYNLASGSVQLTNVTIANNSASGTNGGGLSNSSASMTLKNTIVANNSNRNCFGTVTSLGNNLENANDCGLAASGDIKNTDPFLGALVSNGGPTLTEALLPGSPAINAGDNSGCPSTDQRGAPRPRTAANRCDIGAFEAWYLFLPLIMK